ncbi:hypothetical protein BR141012304_10539 [Brucella inopinata]|nr:hypothetical protein BR141012304_10539 [Brucella inopinata]
MAEPGGASAGSPLTHRVRLSFFKQAPQPHGMNTILNDRKFCILENIILI